MRIAYMTNDEVNRDLVARSVAECGAVVLAVLPMQPSPDGPFDAVLYDLDGVPRDERPAFLEQLHGARPGRPTAVHGYDITDEQLGALDRDGVAVARRLHPRLVRRLLGAARRTRESAPPAGVGTQLTWVNLVD